MQNSQEIVSELIKKTIQLSKEDLLAYILCNYKVDKSESKLDLGIKQVTNHPDVAQSAAIKHKRYVTSPEKAQEIYSKIVKDNTPPDVANVKIIRDVSKAFNRATVIMKNESESDEMRKQSAIFLEIMKAGASVDDLNKFNDLLHAYDIQKDLEIHSKLSSSCDSQENFDSELKNLMNQKPDPNLSYLNLSTRAKEINITEEDLNTAEMLSNLANELQNLQKNIRVNQDILSLKNMHDKIHKAKDAINQNTSMFKHAKNLEELPKQTSFDDKVGSGFIKFGDKE